MRRTPAPTAPSLMILNRPMSPVRRTWVPPHSSVEKILFSFAGLPPIETTRTSSPYFSPNSAIAPASIAACGVIRRVSTASLSRTRSLTSRSTTAMSSGVIPLLWLKSKRRRSGATSEPFCVTCAPSRRRSASCKQVSRRVVRAQAGAALAVDLHLDRIADLHLALGHLAEVHEQVADLALNVADRNGRAARGGQRAGVAHLAARLAVERRLVGDQRDLVACLGGFHFGAVLEQRDDLAFRLFGRIAEELGGAEALAQIEPHRFGRRLARAGPGRARTLALLLELDVEAVDIHLDAAVAQDRLREVEREAAAVGQLERDRAAQLAVLGQAAAARDRALQFLEAGAEGLLEAGLLQLQRLGDDRLRADQLLIGLAHLLHQRRHQLPHQRLGAADLVRVAHRAAHDPAQHVAAAFVRRQHAVGDQERGRSADGRR